MKNKLIKILSLSAALNAAVAVLPTSISTVSAYAASSEGYISNIKMETNKGKSITLYTKSSCKSDYKLSKLDDDEKIPTTIYGEVSDNVSKINISSLSLGNSNYTYKITKGSSEYDLDDDIKVSDGTNTIKVAVYDGSTLKETYSVKIDKDNDDDDDNIGDDVYLDDVTLSCNFENVKLGFNSKKYEYNIQVENEVNYLRIAAEPEDNDDRVKVNGVKVKDEDDWETKVSLAEGSNKIEIEVRDEDDENIRTYVINVTRLKTGQSVNNAQIITTTAATTSQSTTTSTTTSSSQNTSSVQTTSETGKSGWQLATNGKWHLYDINGQLCKSSWYFDNKTGKSFYLDATGNTASGWTVLDGKTYYFDLISGAKKTGWINLDGTWYHLDANGVLIG